MTEDTPTPQRRMRGFEQAAGLMKDRIRTVGESRGFAVSRLLTHWDEIAGADIAAIARPVRISYGKGGFGATLTLLCAGPSAPVVQMRLPAIRERVNAVYGYNAVSRISITQTAPDMDPNATAPATGFADPAAPAPVRPVRRTAADAGLNTDASDPMLRSALEALAGNVLSRAESKKGTS